MLLQLFFDYLNVNFPLLCSQFNTGYNDVSLLKHAEISITWYGIQHKKFNISYSI